MSQLRQAAPLVDLTLLRAIDALLSSHATTETLLIVRDAVTESANEMRHDGQDECAGQLGWIASWLDVEAEHRREWGLDWRAHQT